MEYPYHHICTKANRTLGFLRRNLFSCPRAVKEAAYKGLVRPVLEYVFPSLLHSCVLWTNFSPIRTPGEIMPFGVSPVNYTYYGSRIVRKPDFCLCENKGADQLRSNCAADQRLCFHHSDSTIPLPLKSEISSC